MARATVKREGIEVLSMNAVKNSKGSGKLLAFATVRIGDVAISGIKVMDGNNGKFVSMPSQKSGDTYYNTVWLATEGGKETNKKMYQELEDAVLDYYEDNLE